MRLPFFDRFIKNHSLQSVDMEEVIDKLLREIMRNPQNDYEQAANNIDASIDYARIAMEQIELHAPVLLQTMQQIAQEPDDTILSEKTGIILPYIAQLREIMDRQSYEDDIFLLEDD